MTNITKNSALKNLKTKLQKFNNSLVHHIRPMDTIVSALDECQISDLSEEDALEIFESIDSYITKFQEIEQNELPKLIKFWNMLEKRVTDGIEQHKTEIKNWNIAKNGEDFGDDDNINLYENFDWYKRMSE